MLKTAVIYGIRKACLNPFVFAHISCLSNCKTYYLSKTPLFIIFLKLEGWVEECVVLKNACKWLIIRIGTKRSILVFKILYEIFEILY